MSTRIEYVSDQGYLDGEDFGKSLILQLDPPGREPFGAGVYVCVQSYDETKQHEQLTPLIHAKKVRVTLEVIE